MLSGMLLIHVFVSSTRVNDLLDNFGNNVV